MKEYEDMTREELLEVIEDLEIQVDSYRVEAQDIEDELRWTEDQLADCQEAYEEIVEDCDA